jgi:basic membrane protein A and related proteins
VVPLIFQLEEGSYLAGMMAGGMSKSGIVGMVGGVEIPPAKATFLAFEAGARAVNPDIEFFESFVGNWEDVAAAKEATIAQLQRGADVIIHNMDGGSFGIFQAVREAVEGGAEVWALGMNNDQNHVAPDIILGSAVLRIGMSFMETAAAWQAGEIGGAPIYAGSTGNVVDFVVNPAVQDQIPAAVIDAIQQARSSIREGDLEVPSIRFVEGEPGDS